MNTVSPPGNSSGAVWQERSSDREGPSIICESFRSRYGIIVEGDSPQGIVRRILLNDSTQGVNTRPEAIASL